MIIAFDRIRAQIYDKVENCIVYESKWYDDYDEAYNDGCTQLEKIREHCKEQCEDCFCMLQIDVENRNINGMSYSRYIAAQILSDSNLENEEYYDKEDEITQIIDDALLVLNDTYLKEKRKENENYPFNEG